MATQTTNYNLIKPALTDSPPDITALNGNFDIIDNLLKILDDKIVIAVHGTTTAAQIETAVQGGKTVVAYRNGALFPSIFRNGENDYVFSTVVPSGNNNSENTMLYLRVTASGWHQTTYQRTLALKSYVDDELAEKQNALTFDSTPTINSNNPVTSGGVYTALNAKAGLPKRYETRWIEIESGTNAGSFVFSNPAIDYNKAILLPLSEDFNVQWGTTQNRCMVTRNTGSGTVNVGVLLIEFN